MTAEGQKWRTWAALAILVLIWGTTWAAIRISLEGIPPLTGVALRFGIAAAALLALFPVFKVRLGNSRREWAVWITNGLFTFCLSYSLLYWAEQWVPSGLAAVLFATFPLIVAVIAHFALPGEQLTRRGAVGVLIGFAGVAVIFSEDFRALLGPKVAFAASVLLLCPVFSAIGSVSVKKWGAGIHPLSTAAVPMGLCALALGPISRVAEAGREVTFSPRPVARPVLPRPGRLRLSFHRLLLAPQAPHGDRALADQLRRPGRRRDRRQRLHGRAHHPPGDDGRGPGHRGRGGVGAPYGAYVTEYVPAAPANTA